MSQKNKKKDYCHSVNNVNNDLTALLLKISATFNNATGNYVCINLITAILLYSNNVMKRRVLKSAENLVLHIIFSKLFWIHYCSLFIYFCQ